MSVECEYVRRPGKRKTAPRGGAPRQDIGFPGGGVHTPQRLRVFLAGGVLTPRNLRELPGGGSNHYFHCASGL